MNILFHCDDLCLTENISRVLYHALNTRKIKSVSCVVNTINIKSWIKKFSKKKININLHLNLLDGKPISKNLKYIVNKKNYFNNSFIKIFFYSFFPNYHPFKLEIKKEIESQLKIYFLNIKKNKIRYVALDSHQHIHSIPWILNIIISFKDKYNINFIRSLDEPFILSSFKLIFKKWFYINLIKFFLLKLLNINISKKLKKNKIKTNKNFFGIIQSGNIDKIYISKLKKYYSNDSQILIHPGYAKKKEVNIFNKIKDIKYFLSLKRKKELKLIYT